MSPNYAASVRARLANQVAVRGVDLQRLLVEYGNERLLCRLARTPHASSFILKGATLFAVWTGRPHRATRDIDLLGHGDPSAERLAAVFRDVAAVDIPEDGIVFDPDSVTTAPIRKDTGYGGVRVTLLGRLASARLAMQVDVGFGDAVVPPPELAEVPCLLSDLPTTTMRAYPREVVIAEKYAAMVLLGPANSRMKDFYDVWYLSTRCAFDGARLASAITSTFDRRGIPAPSTPPLPLTAAFAALEGKEAQWRGFGRRADAGDLPELQVVTEAIHDFLWPMPTGAWAPGGPWVR